MISRPAANPKHDEVRTASFISVVKGSKRRQQLSSQQRRQWQSTEPKNRELHNENTLTQLRRQSHSSLSLLLLLQISPTSCLGYGAPHYYYYTQLYRQSTHRAHRGVMCARHQNWLLFPAGNWKGVQQLLEGMALPKPLLGLQGFGQKCSISSYQGEQFWKDKGHLKSSGWVSSWEKTQV